MLTADRAHPSWIDDYAIGGCGAWEYGVRYGKRSLRGHRRSRFTNLFLARDEEW